MGAKKRKQGAEQVVAGVGKICKNMKIGKTLENGLGVVGGAPDRGGRGELMLNRSVAKTKTTKHKQTFRTSAGGGGV